jgi:hypothetical protein
LPSLFIALFCRLTKFKISIEKTKVNSQTAHVNLILFASGGVRYLRNLMVSSFPDTASVSFLLVKGSWVFWLYVSLLNTPLIFGFYGEDVKLWSGKIVLVAFWTFFDPDTNFFSPSTPTLCMCKVLVL